jgi:Protein of unknown function (DUF3606)
MPQISSSSAKPAGNCGGVCSSDAFRGRKQDCARVAGGQDYEVKYETKKTGKSSAAVKKAVKKVGNSRKRVERRLGR